MEEADRKGKTDFRRPIDCDGRPAATREESDVRSGQSGSGDIEEAGSRGGNASAADQELSAAATMPSSISRSGISRNPLSSTTSFTQSSTPSAHNIPELDPLARDPKSLRKHYHILHLSLEQYFRRHQANETLSVTLTFARDVRSSYEAQRHLNSLNNAIRKRYGGYFWVLQLHHCGRIHFHLVIPAGFDCHNDTDLEAWARKDRYSPAQKRASMNRALRTESDWWEAKAASHGFGRIEVAPIHSTGEWLSKYLLKRPTGVQLNFLEKRTRFWGCSKHLKAGTIKFSWVSAGAKLGRQRKAAWAATHGCNSLEEVRERFGRHWGYMFLCDMEYARRVSSCSEQVMEPSLTSAGSAASPLSSPAETPPSICLEDDSSCGGAGAPRQDPRSGSDGAVWARRTSAPQGAGSSDRSAAEGGAPDARGADSRAHDCGSRPSTRPAFRWLPDPSGRPQPDVTATIRHRSPANTRILPVKMPSSSAVNDNKKDLAS